MIESIAMLTWVIAFAIVFVSGVAAYLLWRIVTENDGEDVDRLRDIEDNLRALSAQVNYLEDVLEELTEGVKRTHVG